MESVMLNAGAILEADPESNSNVESFSPTKNPNHLYKQSENDGPGMLMMQGCTVIPPQNQYEIA